jgi:hypothetical protein
MRKEKDLFQSAVNSAGFSGWETAHVAAIDALFYSDISSAIA